MDDKRLAQQLQATGDLMDLLNDSDWLQETAAAEAACSGDVEAGAGLKSYVKQIQMTPPDVLKQQRRQVKVLSVLLPVLHDWLSGWELGLSFEAVYAEAQKVVYRRLEQVTGEQSDWIGALLAEGDQHLLMADRPSQAQVEETLSEILTPADWQVLATVAAKDMAAGILKRARVKGEAPIAV